MKKFKMGVCDTRIYCCEFSDMAYQIRIVTAINFKFQTCKIDSNAKFYDAHIYKLNSFGCAICNRIILNSDQAQTLFNVYILSGIGGCKHYLLEQGYEEI